MAVCRGGVSLWVGCIRSHGGRQSLRNQSWSVWQTIDTHLNGPGRVLSSASWALVPPNSLRYQSVKKPSLSHPFHHACQPCSDRAHSLEEEFEETLSLCVLLKPSETDEQHTLVKVPLFGQVKLGDNLLTSKPTDFVFPLTTVDGRREDDISIIVMPWTEKRPEQRERGSFRSLFETEGCPAPFILGSHFYCFHCPGMEPAVSMARDRLRIELEEPPCSQSSSTFLCSPTETDGMDKGPGGRDKGNEEKLSLMYERLRIELPGFFVKNHDYSLYSSDVEFINGLLNTKTRGRVAYLLTLSLWRLLCLCYYADVRMEVLKLTKHPEDGSIKARWRIRGLPFHTLMLRFYKKDKTHLYRTYDAFSTFYVGFDGRVHCHKVEKVMQAQPPAVSKVTSLLAGALVALGIQEHRPALNLLPLFFSFFRQGRD